MYFVLRNASGEFFAGFKHGGERFMVIPAFVKPEPGKSLSAMIIHIDDIAQTFEDLAKHNIAVERIMVG